MATLRASSVVKNRPLLYSEVKATSEYANDIAFDSILTVSDNPNSNCKLQIILKIFLLQIVPDKTTALMLKAIAGALGISPNRDVGYKQDWNKNSKMIKDWQGSEWNDFVGEFTRQAEKWNRKFWLMPSVDFPHFDVVQGTKVYRPNVVCEFKLEVVYTPVIAHHTVSVVNLYSPNDSFRSDSATYERNDVKDTTNWSQERMDQWREHKQNTVVHEIGHAIGLPHIGQTKSLPNCTLALIFSKAKVPKEVIPAIYRDGNGANVCYGDFAAQGDADNVMGMGDKFAPENAQPWLDRLRHHLNVPVTMDNWSVYTKEALPTSMVGYY